MMREKKKKKKKKEEYKADELPKTIKSVYKSKSNSKK